MVSLTLSLRSSTSKIGSTTKTQRHQEDRDNEWGVGAVDLPAFFVSWCLGGSIASEVPQP